MIKLSKEGLRNGVPSELLKCAYLCSPQKLHDEFQKLGIKVSNEKELEALIEICKQKADVGGKLKVNGNPVMFDSVRVLDNIELDQEEFDAVTSNQEILVP